MAPHPLLGKKAPPFTIMSSTGTPYQVQPGRTGRPMALFFFPGAGSYLCTRETCSFRDALATNDIYKRTGVEVVGVSGDGLDMQSDFIDKHGIKYPLLCDIEGIARSKFQVGKGPFGMIEARMTFFIDASGIVRGICDTFFNFSSHGEFLEKWLRAIDEEKNLSRGFAFMA